MPVRARHRREASRIRRRQLSQQKGEVGDLLSAPKTGGPANAVAIDGVIYRDDWTQRIPEDAQVVLIPRIAGG